jgi:hypothetical protein
MPTKGFVYHAWQVAYFRWGGNWNILAVKDVAPSEKAYPNPPRFARIYRVLKAGLNI